jgi:hypothetical protein
MTRSFIQKALCSEVIKDFLERWKIMDNAPNLFNHITIGSILMCLRRIYFSTTLLYLDIPYVYFLRSYSLRFLYNLFFFKSNFQFFQFIIQFPWFSYIGSCFKFPFSLNSFLQVLIVHVNILNVLDYF